MEKAIFSVVNNRRVFHAMLRPAYLMQKPFEQNGYIRHLPMFLSKLSEFRSLPAIAESPFRDQITKIQQPKETTEKAAFYAGCLIDFSYPEMGQAVVKILNKAGIEVTFPDEQTCCGAPARYSGAYEVAAQNAADNIKALLKENVDFVVSACPTCTVALKREFIKTFESLHMTDRIPKAQELAAKTMDFSTLIEKLVNEGRLTLKERSQLGQVTYHDSCHLKKTLHASDAPRHMLTKAG